MFGVQGLGGKRIVTGATDNAMVYGLLVWASSLQSTKAAPFHLVVAYFVGHLHEPQQRVIAQVLEELGIEHSFLPLETDNRFIQQGHISPTTFTKFLIADAIPETHVWIDIDTVALPGWDDLFLEIEKTPLEKDLVVATRGNRVAVPLGSDMIVPSDLPFNAGVLGWPKRVRKDWVSELAKVGDVPTIEQYVFNTLYAHSVRTVSESFNLLTYRVDALEHDKLPRIIHYAGVHKPWHLPRNLTRPCEAHNCPWSLWLKAEHEMLRSLSGSPGFTLVKREQKKALRSGRFRFTRDHSGLRLLKILRILGPLGWLVVLVAKPLSRWVPRGTHPLH